MKNLPTNLEILNAIYDRYYEDFASFSEADPSRTAKVYMPIKIDQIASDLDVDPDIIFGRLHYDLQKRYGYKNDDDDTFVHFFSVQIREDRHCVNFPYMASVLANLRDEHQKYWVATFVSFISLAIAILAIVISVLSFLPSD